MKDAPSANAPSANDLLDALPDGLLCLDPAGTILQTNPAMVNLTGFSKRQLVGSNVRMLLPPHESNASTLHQLLEQGTSASLTDGGIPRDHFICAQDGRLLTVGIRVASWHQAGHNYRIACFRDLTERKRYEDGLQHQARHDPLTGLMNRRQLDLEMQQALNGATTPLTALIFLDLDGFKQINDRLGHAVGDLLLIEAGQRMRQTLRQGDILARLGGDEFVILIKVLRQHEDAIHIAEKLLAELARPYFLNGDSHQATGSIGLAFYPDDAQSPEQLLHCADLAMYHAKHRGRALIARYEAAMQAPGDTLR